MLDPRVLTRSGTVLLDSALPDETNRRSWCFAGPSRILTTDAPDEVSSLLEEVERATQTGAYVAGYLSYEAGYPLVGLSPPDSTGSPLAWFGVYDAPVLLAPVEVDRGLSALDAPAEVQAVSFEEDRADYVRTLEEIRRHIGEGNVYQVNYTAPVRFSLTGDPRVLYRRLRRRQHVPYGAYLNLGDRQVLSCSPELFFRRRGDRVVTRPMKGTIRRGRTLEEDRSLRETLAADPKNRAENLMIVDLLRNDLSVCCEPGSVEVPALYTIEPYDSVTQMTSTVEGRLQPDRGLSDVLRALFPCGSVTGAPKRRAMRLIRSLERAPRGVYCGAVGMAGPETATFNVAIRTVVLEGQKGRMGVGSGVVWDSDPEQEYEECRLKTRFLTPSATSPQVEHPDEELRLIETMRYENGRIPLLDRHLERLARSAEYFGYPFDERRLRRRLRRSVAGAAADARLKVRLTLDRWGRMEVDTAALPESSAEAWLLAIADDRVDSEDPLFYHKTTHRQVYDRALRAARTEGYDEALFLNEKGHVTEGTVSNLFVQDGEELVTPPVDSGLLGGVYRAHVLETEAQAREKVLTVRDLREADALYCCNAVRGWVRAELHAEPAEVS